MFWPRYSRSAEAPAPQQKGAAAGAAQPVQTVADLHCNVEHRVRLLPPQDHARHLLAWAQGPGGFADEWALHTDLEEMYAAMCIEMSLQPYSWIAVARPLGRLIGQKRRETTPPIRGKRKRVYFIPRQTPELAARDGHVVPRRTA
jgi:hypothetical protein